MDANLKARFSATAGPHDLGVTFVAKGAPVLERLRQPYKASFNFHRHPRLSPAVFQVTITGPFDAKGPGDTPSRRRLFVQYPKIAGEEDACASESLADAGPPRLSPPCDVLRTSRAAHGSIASRGSSAEISTPASRPRSVRCS